MAGALKIGYVLDRLAPSETFIRRELDGLRDAGLPPRLFLLRGGNPDSLGFHFSGLFQWRLAFAVADHARKLAAYSRIDAARLLRRLPQVVRLIRLARAEGIGLLNAQFAGITADFAAVAARVSGIPWVCSVHANDVFASPPGLLGFRLSTAKKIIACSNLAAECVRRAVPDPGRVEVVHHGLPLAEYPFRHCPDTPPVLFAAARLEAKKGLDTLLDAAAELARRKIDFKCAIAGDGPLRSALAARAEKNGIAERVEWLGWKTPPEIRSLIAGARVVVLPSRVLPDGDRDGIANVVLEAMALGTVAVTTTAGAAGEIIRNGENGFIIAPDHPLLLADTLENALRQDLSPLAVAARATVEAEFDLANNIRKTCDVLQSARDDRI
ncbi:MAG: glycosyltransferase family 4 protein [Kiritimatiellae bacterium]|nr:glycosyltransferase family 4 protein [Kiritimatiellia bacterium]